MKVRKAIFDKRVFEKKTIMDLYATKKLFPMLLFLVIMYKIGNSIPFGEFSHREESRFAFYKAVQAAG